MVTSLLYTLRGQWRNISIIICAGKEKGRETKGEENFSKVSSGLVLFHTTVLVPQKLYGPLISSPYNFLFPLKHSRAKHSVTRKHHSIVRFPKILGIGLHASLDFSIILWPKLWIRLSMDQKLFVKKW